MDVKARDFSRVSTLHDLWQVMDWIENEPGKLLFLVEAVTFCLLLILMDGLLKFRIKELKYSAGMRILSG